jgi:hypothetical protein
MWRRYDQMHRFPAGLLVFGAAIASFKPSYGQGMTMAALQALALKDCLARGDADLSRRFFAAAAQPLGMVWQANRITGEFAPASRQRQRGRATTPLKQVQRRLMAWWMDQIMTAVGNDIVIAETLFRVRNLTAPPTRLQDPRFHARVVVANLRRRHTYLSYSSLRRPIVDDIAAERAALVESLSALGPSARTACGNWTALDLAAHLVSKNATVVC